MPNCPQCGADCVPGRRFCGKCGSGLAAPAPDPVISQNKQESKQDASPVPAVSPATLTAGVGKLGFKITRRQVGGIVIATMAGMVVARVLPFLMPETIGRIESIIFIGPLAAYRSGDLVSSVNSWIVTLLTMLASGMVSRLFFRKSPARAAA